MPRLRFALVLVGALALTLSACGDSDAETVDIPKARNEILKAVNEVYGSQFDVDNARCPDSVPMEEGLVFFCSVDVNGQTLRINMRQTNDKGAVRFAQSESVLVTQKVEDFVVSYLDENGEPGSQVACGDTEVLIRAPGKEVRCTVKYADGTPAVARVGVKDTSANTALLSIKPST
jgi:hypothetical protein